jgi:hypothetical protein
VQPSSSEINDTVPLRGSDRNREIVAEYATGAVSLNGLARKHGISPQAVHQIIKRHGGVRSNPRVSRLLRRGQRARDAAIFGAVVRVLSNSPAPAQADTDLFAKYVRGLVDKEPGERS